MRCIIVAVTLAIASAAGAQHHHPPQDAAIHELFYRDWMRPDAPTISCCNLQDCYPAASRMVDGQWQARRREDGVWIVVPPAKVEINRDSPDGRSHLCAQPGGQAICFIPGAGT